MSGSNSTSSSSSNSTSLNSTNSSSLNSTSSNFASSLIESSMNSSPPSAGSSSIRPNANSDKTPAPGQNAPPPSSPSSSSPSPSLASPPPDNATPTPPASSSPPPSPPSNLEPPKASLPPPQSLPPPSSPPPPSPSPPPTPSTSSPQSPSPPPVSLSPLPPPANSSPSPPSETGSPPSSSTSASSPPPPVSSSLEEFIPPPPPLTNSPPGASANSSGSTPPSSQNATSGLGTSTTSNHTSHSIPTSSPSSSGSSSSSRGSNQPSSTSTGTIVGAAVGGILVIAFIALVFVLVHRRKKKDSNFKAPYAPAGNIAVQADGTYYGQNGQNMGYSGQSNHSHNAMQGTHSGMVNSFGSPNGHVYHGGGVHESGMIAGTKSVFNYEELMEITNGFSRQNIIGEGGFGCVYKGQLPDGRVVAVKQLKTGSGQGEREFRAEVEIISRVHHRHLVSLVGYCISEQQRLLIYEFVPNKTLDHHLHGKGMPVLEWTKRVKIALGSAKGLAYLHEDCHPKIIHRDIKSANILLDDTFEAQVADFGLAKLNNDTNTHVSTRVMGTFGYLAPEYASSGKLTDRSDVFSFGVVLLELLTGRKPVDASQPLGEESLVEWARPHLIRALEMGDFSDLVDPRLGKSYVESEMFTMIEVAAACIRHSAPKRPRMVQVVRALDSEGEMSDLTNGVKFGQSIAYNSSQYSEDIMRFRRMALGGDDSMEYGTSGEHSGANPTSWKSRESSSEFTSGESETRPIKPLISGKRF